MTLNDQNTNELFNVFEVVTLQKQTLKINQNFKFVI